jgi:hypothetical protein
LEGSVKKAEASVIPSLNDVMNAASCALLGDWTPEAKAEVRSHHKKLGKALVAYQKAWEGKRYR